MISEQKGEAFQTVFNQRDIFSYAVYNGFQNVDRFAKWFIPHPASVSIDLGSGANRFIKDLKDMYPQLVKNSSVMGIDINENPDPEKQISEGEFYDPNIAISDFNSIPLASNSVDRIVSVCAFGYYCETIDDLIIQVEEIFRVLKPGGEMRFTATTGTDIFDSSCIIPKENVGIVKPTALLTNPEGYYNKDEIISVNLEAILKDIGFVVERYEDQFFIRKPIPSH